MTEITLVLPFFLPPPQLAPDLVRALNAPALAMLLSRTSGYAVAAADPAARSLPHEQWLARALGVSASGSAAFAAPAMRGFGLDGNTGGNWLIVHPAHIEIARSHLLMNDIRRLALSEDHSRALFDCAKPYFDELGHTLVYGAPGTWFLRADDWAGMDMASPDAATGLNLTDWLPAGERAVAYRKLQNEVQMLWFAHPANAEREARGLAAVNSFWPWGGGATQSRPAPAMLATVDAPAWLDALAQWPRIDLKHDATASNGLNALLHACGEANGRTVLYCGGAAEAALADDWAAWLQQVQRLEQDLFGPLLAALAQGRLARLRLVLDNRDAQAELTTTPMAQRKFWRSPTLDRLLP